MMGVNDIYTSNETILENFDKLIDKIKEESPQIEIYMVSIFQMTQARKSKERNNGKITYINSGLREYAAVDRLTFVMKMLIL